MNLKFLGTVPLYTFFSSTRRREMVENEIHQVADWLDAQKGRSLFIRKEELPIGNQGIKDIDEVQLLLDNISMRQIEREDPDNYLANHELLLHGQGIIQSDRGEMPIPQNVYEIPLFGSFVTRNAQNELYIETEKAIYTIHL